MIDRVVLINTLEDRVTGEIGLGGHHTGLVVLKEALAKSGFNDTILFPSQLLHGMDDYKEQIGGLKSIIGDGSNTAIGVTSTTCNYPVFQDAANLLMATFPQALVVAGGPHFRRELWNIEGDPITAVLRNGLAHAAIQGHGTPFVDLVTKYQGNLEAALQTPGLFTMNHSGEVVGEGHGSFPDLGHAPYAIRGYEARPGKIYYFVSILFDDTCKNNCNFCSRNPPIKVPIEQAKATLDEIFRDLDIAFLNIYDPNPFEPHKLGYYEELFSHFGDRNRRIVKSAYLDPSLLADDEYFPRLWKFLIKYNFREFFIGRDVITEEGARVIGSNLENHPKSQNQLDKEKRGIERFILALNDRNLKRNILGLSSDRSRIALSYIVVPHEPITTHLNMFDEMEQFLSSSSEYVKIGINYLGLIPMPGTRLRRIHFGEIDKPGVYDGRFDYGNVWKPEVGPGSRLINNLQGLLPHGIRSGVPMIQLVRLSKQVALDTYSRL